MAKQVKKIETNESCEKAFENTKLLLKRDTMFMYPTFSKNFVPHMDAINVPLWAIILQNGRPPKIKISKIAICCNRKRIAK